MDLSNPFRVRLARQHLVWLDSLRGGAVTTRAQALRQVLDEAMHRDLVEGTRTTAQKIQRQPRG